MRSPTPAETTGPSSDEEFRRYRVTVRTRLALTWSAMLTGAGIVMMSLVYVLMRFVPTYDLVSSEAAATTPAESASALGPLTETPPDLLAGAEPAGVVGSASDLLITSTDQMLNLLLIVSAIVLVLLAIVGVGVGWAVAGRILAPLQHLNDAARKAAHGDLSQRIRLAGPRDEISDLAANFDDMLAQLERSFATSNRFAMNASHELLTPLATSRAMLDVALAQREDPDDQIVFERLRTMNERSIETVEALLDLARIQSSTAETEPVDLARAAAEVVEACADEAAERDVRVETDLRSGTIEAEPGLVRQLLTNLVHNAIRHNVPEKGYLKVSTWADPDGGATIEVSNSGRVLCPTEVAALSEQFTRGAGRASTSGRGHGLGLSIVAAIADRFEGTLTLEPRLEGGLLVRIAMPASFAQSRWTGLPDRREKQTT